MKLFAYILILFVFFINFKNNNKKINKDEKVISKDLDTKISLPLLSRYDYISYKIPRYNDAFSAFERDDDLVGFGGSSDIRLKKNIKKLQNSLEKIERLNGVQFNWKDNKISKKHNEIGFIAQEFQKEYPELIFKLQEDDKSEEPLLGIDYPKITAILLEGLKELNNKVKLLENKINLK